MTGFDSTQLGGNVSFEMVLKNVDLTRKSLYFQSMKENIETNNDSAFISIKFNKNNEAVNLLVRPDIRDNVSYNWRTASSSNNSISNNDSFYHYIFTIEYNDEADSSELKIYINGSQNGTTQTSNIEKKLTNDIRQSNYIGTQRTTNNPPPYLKAVIKYFKIYQGVLTSSEIENIYNIYNSSPYYNITNGSILKVIEDILMLIIILLIIQTLLNLV